MLVVGGGGGRAEEVKLGCEAVKEEDITLCPAGGSVKSWSWVLGVGIEG